MKTLYLINNLSKREAEQFKAQLKTHKRNTLLELFNVLQKHKEDEAEPEAALMYEKIFKEKYSTAKNYLLRNELRLLNTELYNFIILSETEKKLAQDSPEHHLMLLKRLVDNNQIDAFNREYKALEDYCRKHSRYDILFDIQSMRVVKQIPKSSSSLDNLLYNIEQLNQASNDMLNYATLKFMRAQSSVQSINNMYLERIAPEKKVVPPALPFTSRLPKVIEDYLNKRFTAFTLKGNDKIKLLTETVEYRQKHEAIRNLDWLLPLEEMYLLFHIGTEYYLNNNLKKAIVYFDKCMEIPKIGDNPDSSVVVSNYILVLITQSEYKKAWELLNKYESLLKYPLVHNRMVIARANILLLTQQYSKLLKQLPVVFQNFTDTERYYLSILYLIAYYKTGDTNLYKRELRNLEAMFKYKEKTREYSYEPILGYFKQYVAAHQEKNEAQRQTMLKQLAAEFENASEFFKIGKLFLWMKHEVDAMLGKGKKGKRPLPTSKKALPSR